MIGYALLSTKFNTCRLSIMVSTLVSRSRGWGFKSQHRWENILIFKNYLCKLPNGKKFQLGNNSIAILTGQMSTQTICTSGKKSEWYFRVFS